MTNGYTVTDTKTGREYRFEGDRLASESTCAAHKPRWSELEIYRTVSGAYVLLKMGMSRVVHTSRSCGAGGQHYIETNVDALDANALPCAKCSDGIIPLIGSVYAEKALVTVVVSKTAAGLVESAHLVDDDEVVFLPNIAQRALTNAAAVDESIREAYAVTFIA